MLNQLLLICGREIKFSGMTINVEFVGFVAGHSNRWKVIGKESLNSCCGECDFIICNDIPFGFLDISKIISCVIVSVATWQNARFGSIPKHLKNFVNDNMHNLVGFIFFLLLSLCTKKIAHEIKLRVCKIIGVAPDTPFSYYEHFQWRKISLHFRELFKDLYCHKDTKEAFGVLFELFNEIHVINYTHFNRNHSSFDVVRKIHGDFIYVSRTIKKLFHW